MVFNILRVIYNISSFHLLYNISLNDISKELSFMRIFYLFAFIFIYLVYYMTHKSCVFNIKIFKNITNK